MTQKAPQNPWLMDVRVRERNLRSGALDEKDVEKYLASLPDLEGETESFGIGQPALTGSADAEPEVPEAAASEPEPAEEAAPVAAPAGDAGGSDVTG